MAKPEKFNKEGFEGIWRPESRSLEIYELQKTKTIYLDGTEGGFTTYSHLLDSKKFTNKNLAKDFFFGYTK